ncbi:MAG: hypothetical protein HUU56_15705 [Bdellovibrionaceae bacterium]|nr:hypothetical protein [Pseudobdellovibrionaceae bacterium]
MRGTKRLEKATSWFSNPAMTNGFDLHIALYPTMATSFGVIIMKLSEETSL